MAKKIKIQITSWINGSVLFEYEREDNTIRKTLEEAILKNANLRSADLSSADLSLADLRSANLSSANLSSADLSSANLSSADLRSANLRSANLSSANLSSADLSSANLSSANLSSADLSSANLSSADLRSADLRSANLRSADLRSADLRSANLRSADLSSAVSLPESYINLCSRDMLFIFRSLKSELPALRDKLISGEVDGTAYEEDCACLIGSLAKSKEVSVDKACEFIPYYDKGLHNPGEQWFWQIKEGDTPQDNTFSAHAVFLIDMVLKEKNI